MRSDDENRRKAAMPEITLRDVLSPLFRHKRMMAISFCCVFTAATLVAWLWAAHYYVATMQVVVEQDRSDPAITSAQVANVSNNKGITLDQVASEVVMLQGEDMLRTVVASCGIVKD